MAWLVGDPFMKILKVSLAGLKLLCAPFHIVSEADFSQDWKTV